MKAVAHRDRGQPDLPRPRHRELDGLAGGQLTERVAGIDDDRAAAVADDLPRATTRDRTFRDAFDVHGQQHHPMGRDAFEVGGNQIRGHHLRVRVRDAGGRENIGHRGDQPPCVDRNGPGVSRVGRHQR